MNCTHCGEDIIRCETRYLTGSCWYWACHGWVHAAAREHAGAGADHEAEPREVA
jgi:hypothetical protein